MTVSTIPINVSGSGNHTIVSGTGGTVIQVLGIFFQCNIATTLTIKSGSTALTGSMAFTASGNMNLPYNGNVFLQTNDGDDLIFNFSGLTGQAAGFITYSQ